MSSVLNKLDIWKQFKDFHLIIAIEYNIASISSESETLPHWFAAFSSEAAVAWPFLQHNDKTYMNQANCNFFKSKYKVSWTNEVGNQNLESKTASTIVIEEYTVSWTNEVGKQNLESKTTSTIVIEDLIGKTKCKKTSYVPIIWNGDQSRYLKYGSLRWISMMDAVTSTVTGRDPLLRHVNIWNAKTKTLEYVYWQYPKHQFNKPLLGTAINPWKLNNGPLECETKCS